MLKFKGRQMQFLKVIRLRNLQKCKIKKSLRDCVILTEKASMAFSDGVATNVPSPSRATIFFDRVESDWEIRLHSLFDQLEFHDHVGLNFIACGHVFTFVRREVGSHSCTVLNIDVDKPVC